MCEFLLADPHRCEVSYWCACPRHESRIRDSAVRNPTNCVGTVCGTSRRDRRGSRSAAGSVAGCRARLWTVRCCEETGCARHVQQACPIGDLALSCPSGSVAARSVASGMTRAQPNEVRNHGALDLQVAATTELPDALPPTADRTRHPGDPRGLLDAGQPTIDPRLGGLERQFARRRRHLHPSILARRALGAGPVLRRVKDRLHSPGPGSVFVQSGRDACARRQGRRCEGP